MASAQVAPGAHATEKRAAGVGNTPDRSGGGAELLLLVFAAEKPEKIFG